MSNLSFETTSEQNYRINATQRDQERNAERKLKEQQQTAALICGGRIIEHVTMWTADTGKAMHSTYVEVI